MRASALLTGRRLTLWGTALLVLSWFVYAHTMMVPGLIDRAGRFKGTDYIYFYVMGSLLLEGRTDALYDPDAHLAEGRRRIHPELALYAPHSNYGPQVALAFAPLALLPFGWSLGAFLSLTAVLYAASVWLLWRECPGLRGHGRVVAILAAASPLFFALIRYAQLSAVTLFVWSLAFVALRRERRALAGMVLGFLVFKPQLALVVAVALLAARQWAVIAAAAAAAAAQLLLGWAAGGTDAMAEYFQVLWRLLRNPGLVQIYPTEVHSLRGFFQLLIPSSPAVTALSVASLAAALAMAARGWLSAAPLAVRWSLLLLLTVLASPHLLTYDLVLLTVPLVLLAGWAVDRPGHRHYPAISLLLIALYLAPFSSMLARLTRVQFSVLAMALLAWRAYEVCRRPAPATGEATAL